MSAMRSNPLNEAKGPTGRANQLGLTIYNVTVNVMRLPCAVAFAVPPCASAMERTTERPTPLPPVCELRDASSR